MTPGTPEIPELRRRPLDSPEPRGAAVVVRGHKLLVMARRLDGHAYAVLPGGGIEDGETAEQAAVRELAEECSLTGTAVRRLFDGDHGGRPASYVLIDVPEGEPVLGGPEAETQSEDNHYQPLWATERELPLLGLLPEGIAELVAAEVWPLTVDVVGPDDWPLLERLWQLYQHDLSEFRHSAPGPDGSFAAGRLPAYRDARHLVAYVARRGTVPVGFALVRRGDDRTTLGEFFVARSSRGRGLAAAFAHELFSRHPGTWEIAFQEENPRAAKFWRRLARQAMREVSEQSRAVPGKDHLPPDVWLSGIVDTDWEAWHAPYADPGSSLSRRLRVIQGHLDRVLDETAPEPLRVLSICAGDGRDLLAVLAHRPDATRVNATLVELDPRLTTRAREAAARGGLTAVDVRTADAGDPAAYHEIGAADVVLACGVFGNVPESDVHASIGRLPALCAEGATVVWTRGRNDSDATPTIRRWFAEAGFEEVAFEAPDDATFSVGVHRWSGPSGAGDLGTGRLFTFFR